MPKAIYLDYNATTPVDAAVVQTMLPYLTEHFGNASSMHAFGFRAHSALEAARTQVAALIGADAREIVFTGGGSETDNLALKGVVFRHLPQRPHVVSTNVEHPAVLNTLAYLRARFGVGYTLVPVDGEGRVDPQIVASAIRPDTVLVSIMHANNEVGTLAPIEAIGALCRERGVILHVDAAQSAGKVPIDVGAMGVDLLTLAGHKLYGPKGIGALYVRAGVQLDPLIHGSGQEHGLRAGTENVSSSVGLGMACHIAGGTLSREIPRLIELRDRLFRSLRASVPGLQLNGHPEYRLPNTLNISFPGVSGSAVLQFAPHVAASTGSACHSGTGDPSPTLLAMGLSRERAIGAVRLSLGRGSSESDIEVAARALADAFGLVSGSAARVGGLSG